MSNEDIEQTLIPKDDEEQWRKVLHGELAVVDDNDTHVDAATIRSYLIARDEAIAINSVAKTDDLSIISEEEARVVYQQATQEIKARGENRWLDFLKTYGAGALIGGLAMAVLFLLFAPKPKTLTSPPISHDDDLNYSDYRSMKFGELPGPFPNMLLIAGGRINMGCAKGWDDASGGCRGSEYPSHSVDVKTFEISQHEVTVGQFNKFVENTQYKTDAEKEGKGCVHKDIHAKGQPYVMNAELSWRSPGYEQNQGYPVSCVSWTDAQAYVNWLSAETGTTYRLPTEAEWERAARGRQATAHFWGADANHNQANYGGVGGQDQWEFASPVGRFPANKFAVQDTSGNLWEWVQDCWHDTYNNAPKDGSAWESDCDTSDDKVRRGGAWDAGTAGIRSAIRSPGALHDRSHVYGFRVARDWQKPKK